MKILSLVCLCLILINCEDKQTRQQKNNLKTNSISTVESKTEPKDTIEEFKREFPELTDKNAMEFFLQYDKVNKEDKVRIRTDFGTIDILLFDSTKFHRSNFIFLTKQGYFNGTQFHRVVNNFIIQGGNSDDREIAKRRSYIGRYLLPTDTKHGYHHSRGVISMPSGEIENPHKLASPYEFFIMQKDALHLDGDYTVFGKVISGMDVVDKIAAQPTDEAEWPLHNIYIRTVEVIK
ncbi:peptidylprolyl isomerase [Flavobacteriaceae bacterium LMO-SS05]